MKTIKLFSVLFVALVCQQFIMAQTPTFTWEGATELVTAWAGSTTAAPVQPFDIKVSNGVTLRQIGTTGTANSHFTLDNGNTVGLLNSLGNDAATLSLSTADRYISSIKVTYSANQTTTPATAYLYVGYSPTVQLLGGTDANAVLENCEADAAGVTGWEIPETKTFTPPVGTKFVFFAKNRSCNGSTANTTNVRIYKIELYTASATAVNGVNAQSVSVLVNNMNQLIINGAPNSEYNVYNATGKLIFQGNTNVESSKLKLLKGIYLVKVNGFSTKVIVK